MRVLNIIDIMLNHGHGKEFVRKIMGLKWIMSENDLALY